MKLQASHQTTLSHEQFLLAVRKGVQRDLQQLRKTAMLLQQAGREQECLALLVVAREMLDDPAKFSGRKDRPASPSAAIGTSFSPGPVLTGRDLIGQTARSTSGQKLGEIVDILIDPENAGRAAVILSDGGLLGFGAKKVLVPSNAITLAKSGEVIVHGLSQRLLKITPAYQPGDWDVLNIEMWQDAACQAKDSDGDRVALNHQ